MKKNKIRLKGIIEIEGVDNELWSIEQDNDSRFYITSTKGYNGYEGEGYESLSWAIHNVNKHIKNYYHDRCLEENK